MPFHLVLTAFIGHLQPLLRVDLGISRDVGVQTIFVEALVRDRGPAGFSFAPTPASLPKMGLSIWAIQGGVDGPINYLGLIFFGELLSKSQGQSGIVGVVPLQPVF